MRETSSDFEPTEEAFEEVSEAAPDPAPSVYAGRGRPKGAPRSSHYRGVTKHKRSGRSAPHRAHIRLVRPARAQQAVTSVIQRAQQRVTSSAQDQGPGARFWTGQLLLLLRSSPACVWPCCEGAQHSSWLHRTGVRAGRQAFAVQHAPCAAGQGQACTSQGAPHSAQCCPAP